MILQDLVGTSFDWVYKNAIEKSQKFLESQMNKSENWALLIELLERIAYYIHTIDFVIRNHTKGFEAAKEDVRR